MQPTLYFERDKHIFRHRILITLLTVKIKDLLQANSSEQMMFGKARIHNFPKVGLVICRPSLLLREGKRNITITFHAENNVWLDQFEKMVAKLESGKQLDKKEKVNL